MDYLFELKFKDKYKSVYCTVHPLSTGVVITKSLAIYPANENNNLFPFCAMYLVN